MANNFNKKYLTSSPRCRIQNDSKQVRRLHCDGRQVKKTITTNLSKYASMNTVWCFSPTSGSV